MTFFAVVDLETTGLHPAYHHRIIEIAVVTVGPAGIDDAWSTLLNPDRDLGPTDLHGITGHDIRNAPRFDDVAGEVLARLKGRVPVAHNARFDRVFLESEFSRIGIDISDASWLCTLALASGLGHGGRLADCCAACGILLSDAHTALGDAHACAGLLRALTEMVRLPDWPTPCGQHWVARPDRHPGLTRSIARSAPRAQSFVGTLVASLDQRALLPIDAPPTAMGYLQVLDRALADRRVSNDELAELTAVAAMYELGHQDIQQLHERYLAQLLAVAMADGIVTTREQADLELVADLLGIAEPLQITPSALPDAPPMLEGLAGKTVCFTGALTCWRDGKPMTREHASTLASAAGLIVCPRVTQSLDLLVVADPESMSGKARKARDYGTRIIAETAFWPLIGVEVT